MKRTTLVLLIALGLVVIYQPLVVAAAVSRTVNLDCPDPCRPCPPCPKTCEEIDYNRIAMTCAQATPPPPVIGTSPTPAVGLQPSSGPRSDVWRVHLNEPPVGSDLLAEAEEDEQANWRPWYSDYRVWLSMVGGLAVGMIIQHQLEDDDVETRVKHRTRIISDPNQPCHGPPGWCKNH